ncbi:MAG: hypothetical protein SFU56_11410 [Capsulimonadales bacterium]|nr:hypothetical protein [Capsulimonadales bacterium]
MRQRTFSLFPFLLVFLCALGTEAKGQDWERWRVGKPSWKVTVKAVGTVSGTITQAGRTTFFNHDVNSSDAKMLCEGTPALWRMPCAISIHRQVTYTVRMEWVYPDGTIGDKPAKNVVVRTSAGAFWAGPSGKTTGSCDNGIGGSKSPVPPGAGEDQSTDKWQVMDGSKGAIQYDVKTSARVSVNGTAASKAYRCNTAVDAVAFPVALVLQGTTIDKGGNHHLLIGQGLSGYVNVNSYPFEPLQQSGWAWTVPGLTFQSWTVSKDATSATVVNGPGPTYLSGFHCYFRKAETEQIQISCNLNVLTPSGPLAVMAVETVKIHEPNHSLKVIRIGPVSFLVNGSGVRAGGSAVAEADPPGIEFEAWADTDKIVDQGNQNLPIFQRGVGYFGQLCALYRQRKNQLPGWNWVRNTGKFVLDNRWPYTTGMRGPGRNSASDSPELGFRYGDYECEVNDHFVMYYMYTPPGTDVQDVPLATVAWVWTAKGRSVEGVWGPNPPGRVTAGGSTRCYDHPEWTDKVVLD